MLRLLVFILAVAGLLVGIWFKDGYILGTAEDGLIFYNISRYFHQAKYSWMEYPGLGSPSLTLIAGKPTYFLLSFLQDRGISGYLIQASVMWFLLISAGIGIYLLVRELFPKLPQKYIFLSVLFYWFNPISIVDVWNRFLLNYIFFFALLPFASYLFIKGLRTGKFFFGFLLNIVLIFYSYAFSYVAFSILLWIWLFLITFYFALFRKDRKSRIFSLKYFILTLILFIVSNSWWTLPLLSLNLSGGSTPTANLFLKQNSPGILDALSKSLGNLTGIFKLTNTSFLAPDSLVWIKFYYSPFLYLVQYFFVGAILYFIIKFRKDSVVLFLGSLFLSSIFLSKGNNSPFGEIYSLIFKNVLILQVFRNPFEKFGFLLALTSTLLFSPSIYELSQKLQNKLNRLYYPLIFIILFLYLGFPLYTGLALTNKFPPTNNYSVGYKVKVPQYYEDANNWLNIQGKNFRYIGFPLKDEGITYKWEKGYAGVELPVALFSSPGILHTTSVPFFNQIIPEIEKTLLSDQDFSMLGNLVNAKYYLLRYDIDYKLRAMADPVIIEQSLMGREKKGEVKKVASFGKVTIWENLKWIDSTFYIARKIEKVKNFDDINIIDIDTSQGDILIDENTPLSIEGMEQNRAALPNISYEKINLTKYIVRLRNATKPYLLFFSELYNDGWQATYENGEALNNHFRANVYGNGWLINHEGDFDISVEFIIQKWMNLGEKISLGSYAVMICTLFLLIYRYRKNKA